MKYTLTLTALLIANWLLWSGHFDNIFLLTLGLFSCLFSVWLSRRMSIVDEEGAPAQLGVRPFTHYAPWLAYQIVVSNIEVAKIVIRPGMKLRRNMITITAKQQSSLGRVMMANSITLTPGTVSVDMRDDQIHVHALNLEGAEDDMSGDMGDRICRLEKSRPEQTGKAS